MSQSEQSMPDQYPLRLFLILLISIFAIEFGIMFVLEGLPSVPLNRWLEAAIDSSVLCLLLAPILYFVQLRPMARHARELEQAGEERERAQARLRTALDSGRLAVWDADLTSGKVWLSEAWAAFLAGPKRETWTTIKDLIDLVHPEDRQMLLDTTIAVLKGARPAYVEEHRMHAVSGEWRWILSQGKVTARSADGRARRASGTTFDITPRKRAEEALKASEEQFRAVIESAPQSILLTGADGRIALVNAQAETTFGYRREELIGRNVELLIPERYRAQHPVLRTEYLAAPTSRAMGAGRDLFVVRRDGEEVPVEIDLRPVRIGGRSYVLASVIDITERKRAQEALERATRMKSEFMASVTHELRTPLNSVIGFAELLKDEVPGPLNPKQAAFAADIMESGQHLLKLVEGILEMSRIDSEAAEMTREDVNVAGALKDCVAAHDGKAHKRGVALRLEDTGEIGNCRVDPNALRRMLDALIDNAIRFTGEGGSVVVSARRADDALEIAIADTGIGIAREDLPKLFKPLTQLDASLARQHGGAGLGLALARRVAELHGGTIEVESEPGRGSTFSLRLRMQEQA